MSINNIKNDEIEIESKMEQIHFLKKIIFFLNNEKYF